MFGRILKYLVKFTERDVQLLSGYNRLTKILLFTSTVIYVYAISPVFKMPCYKSVFIHVLSQFNDS